MTAAGHDASDAVFGRFSVAGFTDDLAAEAAASRGKILLATVKSSTASRHEPLTSPCRASMHAPLAASCAYLGAHICRTTNSVCPGFSRRSALESGARRSCYERQPSNSVADYPFV